MTPDELAAKRKDRARRWASAPSLDGYPVIPDDEETEETLALNPPEPKKRKVEAED